MGMFDYLACGYPLPDREVQDARFQTRDTPAQFLENYEIRADGTLWHEECDYEDRSDPDAEGLMRFAGCLTRVNAHWVQLEDFCGEIAFYTLGGDDGRTTFEFCATFHGGRLQGLSRRERR